MGIAEATRLSKLTRELMSLGAEPFQGGIDHMLADQWIGNMATYFGMVICTGIEKRKIAAFLL